MVMCAPVWRRLCGALLLVALCIMSPSYAFVTLDGVDDYIDLGTSTLYQFPNTSFTVTGWFQTSLSSGSGYLVCKRDQFTDFGGWFVRVNGATGTITARIVNSANTVAAERTTTTTTLNNGTWRHFAVVFTTNTTTLASNDVALYIDGALDQGSRTDSGAGAYQTNNRALLFGALSDLTAGFHSGSLDDIRLYPTALSAENVARIASSRNKYDRVTLAVTGYWPLDDCAEGVSGDGVTFHDRGGSATNGTGVDGANNTGLTCHGSIRMSYPWGAN